VSETWLTVGSINGAVRAVLKNINVRRGLEVGRWMFTFELTTKQQPAAGSPLWLGGRLEVQQEPGRVTPYLGTFLPQLQPVVLSALGSEQTLQLTLQVSQRQLQLIEEGRTGDDLRLDIYLSGYAVQEGQYAQISEAQISHQIGQSDWLALLQRVGYRRFLLLELEAPDPQAQPFRAESTGYYAQAQRHYQNGEWRLTVEGLRQSLASLVGKKADEEESEAEVSETLKALRKESWNGQVGYQMRLEHVRQAAKFLCDLGAHPEADETRRHHAYAALLIVGGLLHAASRSQGESS
jgi:hypothetical protein